MDKALADTCCHKVPTRPFDTYTAISKSIGSGKAMICERSKSENKGKCARLRSEPPVTGLLTNKEHPSETIVFHNKDGNPARANIRQALGYLKDRDRDGYSQPHKGVKASANSDVMYSFTSAQDGNPLQDDVRLCLGDDLKKAQDHCQRQAGDLP
ncbi:hypothetical protein Tco_0894500 [Tanacetum coccineum]|uniref:Uncharacterized protein n=1 Tax=Tanacetum coccineum TaxID=301880 RepID=A0ABQ5CD78_9ASTR